MRMPLLICLFAMVLAVGTAAAPAHAQDNAVNAAADANAADPVANVLANDSVAALPTPTATATPATGNQETRAVAANPSLKPDEVSAAGIALLRLFLMAVVLERALALLFGWRPFIATFDGSGIRTPIALFVAMLVTHYFQTDALVRLFQAYGNPLPDSGGRFFARTLEAMVIAGGSSGVAQMMRQLGFQPPQSAEDLRPKPKNEDEAWISVALDGRGDAVNFPAYVWLTPAGEPPFEAGTIYQYSGRQSFFSYFFRNRGRFPQTGGYVVKPETAYTIQLVDSAGKIFPVNGTHTLGPRAIIDIVVDA
jgi:hypothetical protein